MFDNHARLVFVVVLAAGLAAAPVGAQQPGWSVALEVADRSADDLYSVQFLTRHVGWAVGDSQEGFTGIHHTMDGGRTWERLDLFDGQEHPPIFSAIRFADANNGWIATRTGGLMLRTVDGGRSWIPLEMRDIFNVFANDMLTVGTAGLVVAADAGQIHRTFDGGDTWLHSHIVTPAGMPNGENVMGIALAGSSLFVVSRNPAGQHGGIHRSDDGGATWRSVLEVDQGLRAIAFSDAQNGVAVGRDIAYWTSDGGETWTRALAPGERYRVRYLGTSSLVAVGYNPAVLVSNDGGRSWSAPPGQPPVTRLLDVNVVDEGWWFATSDRPARLFLYYDPAGESSLAVSTITLSRAVSFGDAMLPPGEYRIGAGHVGHEHGLALSLVEPAEGVQIGAEGELAPNQFACSPCEGIVPVEVTYEKQELGASSGDPDAGRVFDVEDTSTGLEVLLDARVPPPAGAAASLGTLGIGEPAGDARSAARSVGGLMGRLGRAASGDVRGALEGVDPDAVARWFRAAEAAPPAAYHAKLRYSIR